MSTILTLLILISGIAVYKAVKRISESRKCPSDKVLRQYFRGQLHGTSQGDQIISHIGGCENCQYKADEFVGKI